MPCIHCAAESLQTLWNLWRWSRGKGFRGVYVLCATLSDASALIYNERRFREKDPLPVSEAN